MRTMKDLIQASLSENPPGEIDCELTIEVESKQWTAYAAHVSNREFLLYCEQGTASFVVDTYGDRAVCELIDWEVDGGQS